MADIDAARALLDLTTEYQRSVESRAEVEAYGGAPLGREPDLIAEEYAATLRRLTAGRG